MSVYGNEVQGGGNFVKWEREGQSFEGTFLRIGQGVNKRDPNKPLYHGVFRKLDTGAEISVNAPTDLLYKLQNSQPGTDLFIEYIGQQPSQRGGFPKKVFRVRPILNRTGGEVVMPGAYAQPVHAPAPQVQTPVVPQAPPAPSFAGDPTTVAGLKAILTQVSSEATAAMMAKFVESYPEAQQIAMLRDTLTRNYGVKL